MDVSEHKTILTREGYDKIKKELDELLTVKRPAIVKRIEEARALGDLNENFDYHDAKRHQGMVESRIQELKLILNTATVVDCSQGNGCITVGSTVVLKDLEEGFEETYTIVGPAEADPSDGKISYESSMGGALLDRKAGDVICVQTPAGEFKCEILSVQ